MASMNHNQKLKKQQKPARTNDDMMNEAEPSLKIHKTPSDQPHFHQPLIFSIQTSSLNAHSLSLSPCKLERHTKRGESREHKNRERQQVGERARINEEKNADSFQCERARKKRRA
jgi:hypothetical protein